MSLMNVAEVAEFLGVKEVRVERLEREHLLIAAEKNEAGEPLFEKDAVEKYKELAQRLGGL
ncbi:helix-turn-helix domain-containing protein [Catenovulum sediminis]|uniref:Helix-turn-helix domain-containing protein n=1 Tax=Catenovulum sediminis TaxID=1740262 RepID=A0ABV1RK64_9ALTE|nr:helix-turn-helix domain-containing protein [Catenovulum sediminis]